MTKHTRPIINRQFKYCHFKRWTWILKLNIGALIYRTSVIPPKSLAYL